MFVPSVLAMSSYRDMDPNSPKAIAARAACVQKFLERHGFLEVNTPRNTSDVHQKVHMEPVYPLDVAEEMGNERMVSFLLQLGASKRARSKVSIFSAASPLTSTRFFFFGWEFHSKSGIQGLFLGLSVSLGGLVFTPDSHSSSRTSCFAKRLQALRSWGSRSTKSSSRSTESARASRASCLKVSSATEEENVEFVWV